MEDTIVNIQNTMEATDLSLMCLPNEVLEIILSFELISPSDVFRFACVNTKCREVCNSNELWKIKFRQRCQHLEKLFVGNQPYDWKAEMKFFLHCNRSVYKKIKCMSSKFYLEQELPQEAFFELQELVEHHCLGYNILIEELMNIIHDNNKYSHLTEKYYAGKALRYFQHLLLKCQWEAFLSLSENQQSLEKGAVLLAQWCQPTLNVRGDMISHQLDEIAQLVKQEVAKRSKFHPVLNFNPTSAETIIEDSFWSIQQCRTILECMNLVLFEHLGFEGNRGNFYDGENSYINVVLEKKTGIPISLCIIYACIAKRLGVLCEPVNFPVHFLLRWKERPGLESHLEYTYIDVFNHGQFMYEKDCITIIPTSVAPEKSAYQSVSTIKVLERMAHNLVEVGRQQGNAGDCLLCLRNALEMLLILRPEDNDSRLLLARVYLHLNINLNDVMDKLKYIQHTDPSRSGIVAYLYQICISKMEFKKQNKNKEKEIHQQRREKDSKVEFATGMIMTHKRYNYNCVIYGWDLQCAADIDWIHQMGVNNLSKKQFQPFYNVLVEDGSNRYAAQENLKIAEVFASIDHPEVGRYFSEYCGNYYAPNAEKEIEYPEDESVRKHLLQDFIFHEYS